MDSDSQRNGPIVPVCAAVITRGGRVLVGRRGRGRTDAGRWEFPGGKLVVGEDPRECLARELDEELGVRARIDGIFDVVNHAYGRRGVLVIFFRATIPDDEVASRDHDLLIWAGPEDLGRLDFLEADRLTAERLIAELGDDDRKTPRVKRRGSGRAGGPPT
jgi:mutator protein MutT